MRDIYEAALTGVEVGGVRFSPARVALAVVLFLAMVLAIRLVQRWLGRAVLAPPRVEAGVAHSIVTVFGYAGFALAAIVALSLAGFDVSSLAIVAGALSIGVGFGLQSIVNNFVSGLILLVERPVKVGDRVEVKGAEGVVRRIGVRATEIQTPDGASLILPNSDLVTGAVTNTTYRAAPARVTVSIGVVHAADPEQVLATLRTMAERTAVLARDPAPVVSFDAVGETALMFSVSGRPAGAADIRLAESRLRSATVHALREAGVELARAATDVRLRDLDPLRVFLARLAEERARRAEAGGVDGPGPGPDNPERT